MAYLRRLHGGPDPAPVGDLSNLDYDLADLALGPESELTPDAGHEKKQQARDAGTEKTSGTQAQ